MKVALVLDDLQVGGIERVCLDYCKLFLNLGYEVSVFNLHPKLNQLEKEIPQGVNVVNIPFSIWVTPERYTKLIKRNYIFRIAYIFIYFLLSILDFFYKIFCKTVYKECREQFDYVISFSSHFNDLTFVADHFVRSKNYMSWCHGAIYSYLLMSDGFINLYNRIKNIVVLVDDAAGSGAAHQRAGHQTEGGGGNGQSLGALQAQLLQLRTIGASGTVAAHHGDRAGGQPQTQIPVEHAGQNAG